MFVSQRPRLGRDLRLSAEMLVAATNIGCIATTLAIHLEMVAKSALSPRLESPTIDQLKLGSQRIGALTIEFTRN